MCEVQPWSFSRPRLVDEILDGPFSKADEYALTQATELTAQGCHNTAQKRSGHAHTHTCMHACMYMSSYIHMELILFCAHLGCRPKQSLDAAWTTVQVSRQQALGSHFARTPERHHAAAIFSQNMLQASTTA